MEGGCAEVEAEGVDVALLRKQTADLKIDSDRRAFELVNAYLRRVATAPVEKI